MSDLPNFTQFRRPGPGFYHEVGARDGEEGHPPRTLQPPDDIYQDAYNDGWNDGQWTKLILDRITI